MASPKPGPRLNPRGGDRRAQRPTVQRPGSSLWYGLAFLMVLGLAQLYFLKPPGRLIPYSELKTLLKQDQIAEVTITDQVIRGTLKQPVPGDPKQSKEFTTTRVDDPKLTEELEARGVKYTGELANRWLADLLSWIIPAIFFIAIWGFFFRRMGGAEGGVMSFARSRAKIYADDEVKVRFTDVAGVDEAEDELKEIVEFLKNPKKYTNLGGRIPKGVLLVGPPGTGKTLLARAVAGEAHVPFFSLSGSEFVEMFVGVGAARIRDLFQQAEAKAPCIVFIDELDALGKVRVQSPLGSHEEREQTLNQLLAEMDGFDSRKGVIIMGATNRPEVLDPALLRPGRFDRQVLVDKPDVKGREQILRIHSRAVKMAPDVDITVVAARTAGFAGADLANLVNEAALLAARNDKTAVDMKDFESAIDRLVAGLEKRRVMSTKEREIVAYHESGHAIVASVLPDLDPVHKISIVQRGFGALGYTMQLPLEDRYLMTRGDLLSQLAVLLAGRTAEEIALGEISTGAQNDLQRATDIARAMVTEFGMSDALGAINYDGNKRARFLDIPMPQERGLHGEDTARLIDAEIKRILTDAHDKARDILTTHRDKLETVTRRLLEIEVMEGDELRRLLGLPPSAHDAADGKIPLPPLDTPLPPAVS
ncbi:MAG TPA: ATP-dependent zinc metalloprotease FtsH [Vicinamibacterales bacterium]